ncbi:uncharacterized protein LOC117123578 isoform X2 [Anneissia japonica]|uniref:uncharacterized protein LOC117123578 isoform X2 n=1 Tax=Anneissia japonica TaxID=1529436 RepID=UPI001425BB3D|nr:uncharacterized protein LOC117123578 isoform X2 [Anneissia japonica]
MVVEMISQIRTRMLVVRKEYDVLYKTACKLHDHCSHCFTRLQRLFTDQDPSIGVESLINLLAKVLELKTYLTGKKCSSLDYYLQKYMKDSFSLSYERYKLIGTTELKLNSYTTPLSPKLMNLLLLNIRSEVDHFQENYQKPFEKFFDLTALAAREFYKSLMQDVGALCEQCLELEHSNDIDLLMLSLAYRLNQLDLKWKNYIPIRLQIWRHQFHSQAKLWLDVLRQHTLSLVIQAVSKDSYKTQILPKEGFPDMLNSHRPRNSSFLQASQTSAFSAVAGLNRVSPLTVEVEIHQQPLKDPPQSAAASKVTRRQISKLSVQTPLQMEHPFSSSIEDESLRNSTTHQEHLLQCPKGRTSMSQAKTKGFKIEKEEVNSVSPDNHKEQLLSEDDARFYTPTPEMEQSKIESYKETGLTDDEVKLLTNDQYENSTYENDSAKETCAQAPNKTFIIREDAREICSSAATTPYSQYEDAFSSLGKESPIKFIANQKSTSVESPGLENPRRFMSPGQMIPHRRFLHSTSSFETASEGTFYPRSLSPSETRASSRIDSPGLYRPHPSVPQMQTCREQSDTMCSTSDSESMQSGDLNSLVDNAPEPEDKMPFSNSVVDMVCIIQRYAEFMQSLCSTIYPILEGKEAQEEMAVDGAGGGDDDSYGGRRSMATATMSWNDAAFQMREELAIKMYMTVTSCLQLYANNMLSIDLCATPATIGSKLIASQVLESIRFNKKQGLIWGCRHMLNGSNDCNKYLNRDADYVSDAFEPVTEEMCIRINNIAALLNLMPSFNGLLATVVGDLESTLDMGMADLHENLWHQSQCHLQQVIDGQTKLIAHKLNLFVHQALKLLTNLNMIGYTIAKRLQPITDFLDNHMIAFSRWLYPESFQKFCHALWENIMEDFKVETEMLKMLDNESDNRALLLLQAIGHMVEFMYHDGDGLDIDFLIKPAEHTMYLLQLHSMDTRHLIALYKQLLSQMEASNDTSSLSMCSGNHVQLPPVEVLHCMYRDLHAIRKCFSGQQLLHWIQTNTESKDPHGVCQMLLDHSIIQTTNQSKNRSRSEDTPISWNSDVHIRMSTSQAFPEISIHSTPHSQFFRNRSISEVFDDVASNSNSNESFQNTDPITEQGIVNEGFISDEVVEGELPPVHDGEVKALGQMDNADITDHSITDNNIQINNPDDLQFNYLTHESFENLSQVGCEKELGADISNDSGITQSQEAVDHSESDRPRPLHGCLMSPISDISITSSQTSSSSRVFTSDEFHFYRFADVDDEELYSMISQVSESSSLNARQRHHSSGLHAKDKAVNPEFVLFIIYNRRKVNKEAKSFSEGISGEITATIKGDSNLKYCWCL